MHCLVGLSLFLEAIGLLSAFISIATTSWIVFLSRFDRSVALQWTGLFQSCTNEGCVNDFDERPFLGKIIMFSMFGSIGITLIGFLFLIFAEAKAKKDFLPISSIFVFCGGTILAACMTIYTLYFDNLIIWNVPNANPEHNYSYILMWTSAGLTLFGGVISMIAGCKKSIEISPFLHHTHHQTSFSHAAKFVRK